MQATFLGTGGGRFTMIKQLRQTGGIYLEHDGFSLMLDPGPGALVHAHRQDIDVTDLDAVLVTHAHVDHYGDMHAMIEAMTGGGDDPSGTLLVSDSVENGAALPDRFASGEGTYGDRIDPPLDAYHRGLVDTADTMDQGDTVDLGPFTLHCGETRHSDPTGVSLRCEIGDRAVGFTGDTELFDGLTDFLRDVDTLVVNVARPRDAAWKGHMTMADAADLIKQVSPEHAVLHHFGAKLVFASVADETEWLQEQVDARVVAADDGMTVDLLEPGQGLDRFLS